MDADVIHDGRFVSRWHSPTVVIADSDAERFDRLHATIAGRFF
ncbi:hypothetical protein [Haladaptatus sp. DYF46]|nr:hypothetical protein [Haladaptatus sp. DYF46]